jgi:hypothetical protein
MKYVVNAMAYNPPSLWAVTKVDRNGKGEDVATFWNLEDAEEYRRWKQVKTVQKIAPADHAGWPQTTADKRKNK